MKHVSLKKKLALSKITIAKLGQEKMDAARGGRIVTYINGGNVCLTEYVASVCRVCYYTEGFEATCLCPS